MPNESLELIDFAKTRRTRRLVRTRSYSSGDYTYSAMFLFFGLEFLVLSTFDGTQFKGQALHAISGMQLVCILLVGVGLMLLWRAWQSYEMDTIEVNFESPKAAVTVAAVTLGWNLERATKNYARAFSSTDYGLGTKVITIVYVGKKGLLVNVRNLSRGRGVRWPISKRERRKVLRQLEVALKAA